MKFTILSFVIFLFSIDCEGQSQNSQFDSSLLLIENNTLDFNNLKNGDIIFQTSLTHQSKAIQLATHSIYSHCGILFIQNGIFFIIEAIQPVKSTPLTEWIKRGERQKIVIKRLKNAAEILTENKIKNLHAEAVKFLNKDYDLTFEWSDDKIYCSELVWKVYHRTLGIKLGELQTLKDLDLTNHTVKKLMHKRYGNQIPLNEFVISPAAIFKSTLLETVFSN